MALRRGFQIPNANTYAPDYQTAQPDAGDFVVLGNDQSGVVLDAEVTLTGLTATIGAGPHIVVHKNEIYIIPGNQSLSLQGPSARPRWDLIVFNPTRGGFMVEPGTSDDNPVYPDVTEDMVVLAAVLIPPTESRGPYCIDKRNLLQRNIVGASTSGSLVRSYNQGSAQVQFNVDGSGKIAWGPEPSTTFIRQVSEGVVGLTAELRAEILTASDSATVRGFNVVTEDDIKWGTGLKPTVGNDNGDVWIDRDTGDIWIWTGSSWELELAPLPTGIVTLSFEPPEKMAGWLPLWGQTFTQGEVGGLWALHPEWRVTGTTMTLPDMRDRFPLGTGFGATAAGSAHGAVVDHNGTMNVALTVGNLPSHNHSAGGTSTTGSGGDHVHAGSALSGGGFGGMATNVSGHHAHAVWDPGHAHTWSGGWPLATLWPGDSSVDAIFNDDDHHYTGQPIEWSNPSNTGIAIAGAGDHQHTTQPIQPHTHALSVSTSGGHTHPIPATSAVGNGTPVAILPPSISLNFYIKI